MNSAVSDLLGFETTSANLPIITGADLEAKVQFIVDGYLRYYNRPMYVPGVPEPVNQVEQWKQYIVMMREMKTEYGEFKGQKKSDLSAHAEVRVVFMFPAFYDPLMNDHEPLLPLIRSEYKKEGYDFPQSKTVAGKKAVLAFHKKYKDLFAVASKM